VLKGQVVVPPPCTGTTVIAGTEQVLPTVNVTVSPCVICDPTNNPGIVSVSNPSAANCSMAYTGSNCNEVTSGTCFYDVRCTWKEPGEVDVTVTQAQAQTNTRSYCVQVSVPGWCYTHFAALVRFAVAKRAVPCAHGCRVTISTQGLGFRV
jgi:hypothetical protein